MQNSLRNEMTDMLCTLSPLYYLKKLNTIRPFAWQEQLINSPHKRIGVNGARQCGKSTIISFKPCHIAKYYPKSVSLIMAPTQRQAVLDMEKVITFMTSDPNYPEIKRDSDEMIELKNGSFIYVVPATETSARGYSKPRLIVLDEASRIPDPVYRSGVMPMLTDNPDCELLLISTPNGREGFFHSAMNNSRWEKWEIRSPWDVLDLEYRLKPAIPETEYRTNRYPVRAFYSLRHRDLEEQQMNLEEMGPLMYRQEYCCEFVEPEDQVFNYEDVEKMFQQQAAPLELEPAAIDPLEV
jgi:hypothetical protein